MAKMRKKKPVDTDVYQLAKQRVREAYRLFDTVAVSFSGGKDSTVVLNIALEVAKELGHNKLMVFFYDEEAISLETVAYAERVSQLPSVDFKWLCLPVQHRNACSRDSPFWYPWAPEDRAKWVRDLPPHAITSVAGWPQDPENRPTLPDSTGLLFPPEQFGRMGMLLGIRAAESITRLRAALAPSRDHSYIRQWSGTYAQGNLSKVMPIYDWQTSDVWTAPRRLGWDYNTSYDLMEKAGISHHDQRCAPPFGEEPLRGLWMYATCFPAIWDKMQSRVPGAATAARYSQTELYSFKKAPEKPAEISWPDFLSHWVNKHPERYRADIAQRVASLITTHFKKTHEPLAVKAPHPETGVSWAFLLKIAIRGDFKNRRQPPLNANKKSMRARYDAEMQR